jgi:hypothetical protein
MSPPEVWGPAVWTLFHTLCEKLNPNAYNQVSSSLFAMIIQICRVLPCPECSRDASGFLAKINLNNYKSKDDFKSMLYLFHNWVNAKKRKPLFNYSYLQKYANLNLVFVLNDFILKYNTKGNMKLLAESFQRSFVIKNFKKWINAYGCAFLPINVHPPISNNTKTQQDQNLTQFVDKNSNQTVKEITNNIVDESAVEISEEVTTQNVDENVEEVTTQNVDENVEEVTIQNVDENVEEVTTQNIDVTPDEIIT